jgi:hypothetical protein
MIDLARDLGARVLNFFFLVRTGRGEGSPISVPSNTSRSSPSGAHPGLGNAEERGSGIDHQPSINPKIRGQSCRALGGLIIRAVRAVLPPHSVYA